MGVIILLSDKVDFTTENYGGQGALHDNERVNLSRKHSNLKYAYSKQQSCQIREAESGRTERTDRSTITVADCNTPLSVIHITAGQHQEEHGRT